LDLEQNLTSSERQLIHREYVAYLRVLIKNQDLPQFAREHAKKLKKELSSKEIASFWDLILEREKLHATAEHDYTLLQQVRTKHVSIGTADVVRVQQNNEEGNQSNVRILRKRKHAEFDSSDSTLESYTDLEYSENNKIKKQVTNINNETIRKSIIAIDESIEESDEIKESNEIEEFISDGYKTPPTGPRNKIVMTTPQKPSLFANSVEYLDNHFSVNINQQYVIMKEKKVDPIPELVHDWIINALSSEKDVFESSIMTSLTPDHKFRKICEIILYDFENPLNRYIGERKYTVERIVPLFKAMQSVYKEFAFDWIEVQLNCIKDMKQLFPQFDMTINKADGVCTKVSSDKEVVFIEVAGGPEVTCAVTKHAREDTEKLIKEAMFGLVSLLRDYLDKNVENSMNICTYMIQVIGDRITLSELCLNKKHSYMISQIKSAILPFSIDEIEKFLEVFELLYALINRLDDQKKRLKKLMLSDITEGVPTVRDWIWVPNSIAEWEVINKNI
ncbi:358_t:CDS:2, partial [Diversispora eburnea]